VSRPESNMDEVRKVHSGEFDLAIGGDAFS
jgi:hypothetical protein